MGTECSVAVSHPVWAGARARVAIEAALAEVAAQERSLSRFDPAQRPDRVERRARALARRSSDRLYTRVAAAVRARDATGGRYDPTVLPALIAAGYDASYRDLRPRTAGSIAGWRAGARIELDPERAAMRLAPGAVGRPGRHRQGPVGDDRAATRCATPGRSCRAGSSTWAATSPSPARRPTAASGGSTSPIRATTAGGSAASASAAGGVATPAATGAGSGRDGEGHHLIDPATGRPAVPGPLGVTVVAPSAAEAEAHATALAITPVEQAAVVSGAAPAALGDRRPGRRRAVHDRSPAAARLDAGREEVAA